LQKTSFDFGKTGIFYENEDLKKSDGADEGILKIGFSQTIEFPTTYFAQSKYNKQYTLLAQANLENSGKELIQNVQSAYYYLWYTVSRQELLQHQDSLFADFEAAAALRFQAGETNKLSCYQPKPGIKRYNLTCRPLIRS
jgi:cobalt-zinc-cadmium resistance protein CzcA